MRDIVVYKNIQFLAGVGEEWVVDKEDKLIAVFFDGNLRSGQTKEINQEPTIGCGAV